VPRADSPAARASAPAAEKKLPRSSVDAPPISRGFPPGGRTFSEGGSFFREGRIFARMVGAHYTRCGGASSPEAYGRTRASTKRFDAGSAVYVVQSSAASPWNAVARSQAKCSGSAAKVYPGTTVLPSSPR
jgi:hypothetical protein